MSSVDTKSPTHDITGSQGDGNAGEAAANPNESTIAQDQPRLTNRERQAIRNAPKERQPDNPRFQHPDQEQHDVEGEEINPHGYPNKLEPQENANVARPELEVNLTYDPLNIDVDNMENRRQRGEQKPEEVKLSNTDQLFAGICDYLDSESPEVRKARTRRAHISPTNISLLIPWSSTFRTNTSPNEGHHSLNAKPKSNLDPVRLAHRPHYANGETASIWVTMRNPELMLPFSAYGKRPNSYDMQQTRLDQTPSPSTYEWLRARYHLWWRRSLFDKWQDSKSVIQTLIMLDLLVDFLFCILYLVELEMVQPYTELPSTYPPWLFVTRPYAIWRIGLTFACWNLLAFIIQFYCSANKLFFLFSLFPLIELTTSVPYIVSAFLGYGQYLWIPYFFRSWVMVLRLERALNWQINLKLSERPFNPLAMRIGILISYIICIVYNGICAFQFCELMFAGIDYNIYTCLYFIVVTLATVGYGDIEPQSWEARMVVVIIIIVALVILPGLISTTVDTFNKAKAGGGQYGSAKLQEHIVVCGHFDTAEKVMDLFRGLLHMESNKHLNIVILSTCPPSDDINRTINTSLYKSRAVYLHGSPILENDLSRAQLRRANSVFLLADRSADNPEQEDQNNTMRMWSAYAYLRGRAQVDIYTYNILPSTKSFQPVVTFAMSSEELKQVLFATNCQYTGAAVLILNLLHQSEPFNGPLEPWQTQYGDGWGNEIYFMDSLEIFVDIPFTQLVLYLYNQFQVILVAINMWSSKRAERHLVLNPGPGYRMRHDDELVIIAQGPEDLDLIGSLNADIFKRSYAAYKLKEDHKHNEEKSGNINEHYMLGLDRRSKIEDYNNREDDKDNEEEAEDNKTDSTLKNASADSEQQTRGETKEDLPFGEHPTDRGRADPQTGITQQDGKLRQGEFRNLPDRKQGDIVIAQPEAPYLDVEPPFCYLLKDPIKDKKSVLLEDATGFHDHILICNTRRESELYVLISALRAAHLGSENIRSIVILLDQVPANNTFELLSVFPNVYYLIGDFLNRRDIGKLGVPTAHKVVILGKTQVKSSNAYADADAVITSQLLYQLMEQSVLDKYVVAELTEKNSMRYLHAMMGGEYVNGDFFQSPLYASGRVILDSSLDFIMWQSYHKPCVKPLVELLCGLRYKNYIAVEAELDVKSAFFCYIPVDPKYAGRPFRSLFAGYISERGMVPLGLLRAADPQGLGNRLPFLYTNPLGSILLRESDLVYVLMR